jgi:DNA-binding NtrC family response regulator
MASDKPQILVVDDESTVLELLQAVLANFGYAAALVKSGPEGLEVYREKRMDLVLVDLGLPGMDGLEVIRQLKKQDEHVKAIAMTGTASIESAVQAMRAGAVDFLSKPLDLDNLRIVLHRALEKKRQHEKVKELEGQVGSGLYFEGMIGTSPPMQEVFAMVRRVAATNATVLIRGESGTGKELVARAIHSLAYIEPKPFFTIDCASIPANLMETELFGHERGAFTDAKEQKKGLLELADGGTLFLDEVGLMPLDLQVKLLNVFETLQFRRVGGTRQLKVSVRFLVATNEDLEEAVKAGRFREDLYYRLNVVPIPLPPLRERGEDIVLLAEHYLKVYAALHELPPRQLSVEARVLLRAYPWLGNVRELRNVIERAVLMTDGEVIRAGDLAIDRRSRRQGREEPSPLHIDQSGRLTVTAFPAQGISLEEVEKQLIQEALRHAGGNITRAATLLSTSRDVMRYRIAKYGLAGK